MRVAFAGTPEFALPALAALCDHHSVVGVLTQPDRPKGRGRQLAASAVKRAALERRLPLAQPETLKNAAGRAALASWAPEILVVVAYGLMLPPEVLTLPRRGCLNIHASLLPRWRGAAPIQRAILAGDAETGVSIMQMDAGLDTGPVLLERRLAITPHHTGASLHDELAQLGAAALLAALDGVGAGTLIARPQPAEGATYAAKIQRVEARIDWARGADEIERRVRAFTPWPVAETSLAGEPLKVLAAWVVPDPDVDDNSQDRGAKIFDPGAILGVRGDLLLVRCGQGTLGLSVVQRPGRRPVSAKDFSHAENLLGQRLG